jgi:hypothetical protein
MAAQFFFDAERFGRISGSSFGEPDGTDHEVEVLEANGHLIVRVEIGDNGPVDLLFTKEQAAEFASAVDSVLLCVGINR